MSRDHIDPDNGITCNCIQRCQLVVNWPSLGLVVLLTARPWAERGSRFTRGLFFFFFVGDQTQTSTRPNFE